MPIIANVIIKPLRPGNTGFFVPEIKARIAVVFMPKILASVAVCYGYLFSIAT